MKVSLWGTLGSRAILYISYVICLKTLQYQNYQKLISFCSFLNLAYQANAAPQITNRMNKTKMNAYLPLPFHPPQQGFTLLQFPIFTPPFTLVYVKK